MLSRLRTFLPTALLSVVGVTLVFSAGYYSGKHGFPARSYQAGDIGRPVQMDNFWATKQLIEDKYVEKADSQQLITGATKGMVESLDDPYSSFLTKDEAKQLNDALAGTVEGIGVEIGIQNTEVTVIAPLPDSPAAKAGIVAGDVIVAVDGQPTKDRTIDDVAKQIRGKSGTQVKINYRRGTAVQEVTLTRQTVKAPSTKIEYRGEVAIITISRFGDETVASVKRYADEIPQRGAKYVVLDLRSNPGGYLEGAIDISSIFLKEGVVVQEQFGRNKKSSKSVKPDGRLAGLPLVVLVNKGSASASEITAGALRDNRGIKLVGEKTFGKGSVQELEELQNGEVLKLTIAKWLTPKGTDISKAGLEPDVVIGSENPGAQLDKALELVRQ